MGVIIIAFAWVLLIYNLTFESSGEMGVAPDSTPVRQAFFIVVGLGPVLLGVIIALGG
jgi:hypothetical protein